MLSWAPSAPRRDDLGDHADAEQDQDHRAEELGGQLVDQLGCPWTGDGSSSLVPAAIDSDDATGVLLDVYSMAPAVPQVPTYVRGRGAAMCPSGKSRQKPKVNSNAAPV